MEHCSYFNYSIGTYNWPVWPFQANTRSVIPSRTIVSADPIFCFFLWGIGSAASTTYFPGKLLEFGKVLGVEGRSVPIISRSRASVKSGFASFGRTTLTSFLRGCFLPKVLSPHFLLSRQSWVMFSGRFGSKAAHQPIKSFFDIVHVYYCSSVP